ncbi:unnamed protein product [Parascedosporium putredinis]|uniref:3-beta hydroxysteroid dehydrogenase/isomerase domain-containing protein n=1 Tax=Parascedosporium putredinis TaxID=1442378 RepID=A0A9P1MCI1_9PEZI|nr:unnamed protein product [Parascedosporium putredinis]CAI7998464.1 unnamed protein product [Parascedosporium putredinis]
MPETIPTVIGGGAVAFAALALWLAHINRYMGTTPPEALAFTPHRWTKKEITDTYDRIKNGGLDWTPHLPPKLDRRYIVVGGSGPVASSGLVGTTLVLQLLARGQDPAAVRIIDFRGPSHDELLSGPGAEVDVALADITSPEAIAAAYAKPWADHVRDLPLTVFHIAAVIRPSERHPLVYDRCAHVNVHGTANSLAAARAAGADIFVATSSSSVGQLPINFFIAPWESEPRHFTQVMTEDDFAKPVRAPDQYFGNYAHTKAVAERLVCDANEFPAGVEGAALAKPGGFRTGIVRPGSPIYGGPQDAVLGLLLASKDPSPTFTAPWIQNWVSNRNVAMAHLLYEQRLLSPTLAPSPPAPSLSPTMAPVLFEDYYTLARTTVAENPPVLQYPPPVLLLVLAQLIEWYCILLWRIPLLKLVFSEPGFLCTGSSLLASQPQPTSSLMIPPLGSHPSRAASDINPCAQRWRACAYKYTITEKPKLGSDTFKNPLPLNSSAVQRASSPKAKS